MATTLATILFFNSQVDYPTHLNRIEHIENISANSNLLKDSLLLLKNANYSQTDNVEQLELNLKRSISYLP
ncbi:MAG: hypothetical protein GQ569_01295, partial [Methylococcaceae bacterium]|nr:hypothetical protein [Methylococcaceae bacterium]